MINLIRYKELQILSALNELELVRNTLKSSEDSNLRRREGLLKNTVETLQASLNRLKGGF